MDDQTPEPSTRSGDEQAGASPHAPLSTIFWIFFQIGSLSVGGGLTAWLYREIVEKHRLMPAEEFMSALTLAQVLPGINMANLAIYVGQRLGGPKGAATAMFGLILVPFFAIITIGTIYAKLRALPNIHHFMDGMAATAVALLLSMGFKSIQVTRMQLAQLGIAAAVVVLVGFLRVPMVPVILVLAPFSVWLCWSGREERDDHGGGGADA